MPLFLVTCLCDDGMGPRNFRVVEAPSRVALAEAMLRDPYRWYDELERSHLWDEISRRWWSPEEWLEKIDVSSIDCDSRYQLAIREITEIEPCVLPQSSGGSRSQGPLTQDD